MHALQIWFLSYKNKSYICKGKSQSVLSNMEFLKAYICWRDYNTFLVCLYVNKLSPVYTNLKVVRTGDTPEKTADISRGHHRFSREMTEKFHTDDACLTTQIWEVLWLANNLLHPIRSTTQIWVKKRHQYGISPRVPLTSFRGETSGGVAKCQLFSLFVNIQVFKLICINLGFWENAHLLLP